MSGTQGRAARLSVGLWVFFGLVSGCATSMPAAVSPHTPPTGCEAGTAASCTSLGARYAQGLGVAKDERRAAVLWEQACTGGDAMGCFNLGVLYEKGVGVSQDECRAATLYGQACHAGLSQACAKR